jgi:acetate---CoA ligase (ADP-forming)
MGKRSEDHTEKSGSRSEYESKLVIREAGVRITREGLARSRDEAAALAESLGFPVAMQGCPDRLTHKTEPGMEKVGISDIQAAAAAYNELQFLMRVVFD